MKKKLLLLLTFVFCVIFLLACTNKKEEKPLVMGLVPISDSEKLIEDIEPLYKKLEEKIGRNVDGFIATNYIGVVEALGTGSIDFALIPPFAFLLANKKNGSEALLTTLSKDGTPGYYSIILARNDRDINDIKDLKNKNIAFVDPSSTSGYIFPAVILNDNNINLEKDIKYRFAGGHDKALQLLLNGDVDAIGTYENIFRKFSKEFPEIGTKTKVIAKSDLIPGITLTVSSKIDDVTKEKIKNAFLEIIATEDGKKMMNELFGINGFEVAKDENYKIVEEKLNKMGIDLEKIK